MSKRTNYQGGSLLGFVIVGVLLTVVLIGGLYGLQTYTNSLDKSGHEVATDNKDSQPAADNGDKTPVKTDEKTATEGKDTTKDAEVSDSAEELPQTGPANSVLQFIGLGVLTFAATAYIRSRYTL